MTDPGSYTTEEHAKEKNLDIILITHEHGDHLHVESLKDIIAGNPQAKIITNESAGKILQETGIKYEVLPKKTEQEVAGVKLEAHDCKHEEIFEEVGQVQNTGYFIGPRLFYPGDSLYNPGKPVEILALPVAGPWTRVRDFMKYALDVKPKICFPVHDGMLNNFSSSHKIPELILSKSGIVFKNFEENNIEEF